MLSERRGSALKLRTIRIAIVVVLAVAMVVVFVPLVRYSYSYTCPPLPASGLAYGNACFPGTHIETGLNSLSRSILGYGGTYSYVSHSYSNDYGLNLGTYRFSIGSSEYMISDFVPGPAVILLAGCIMAGLLSPELVDGADLLSSSLRSRLPAVARGTSAASQEK